MVLCLETAEMNRLNRKTACYVWICSPLNEKINIHKTFSMCCPCRMRIFRLVCTKKDLLVQEVFGNSRLLLSKIKRVLR